MDPQTRLDRQLIGLLRQHSAFCDQRHLLLLGWMVAGLLLSQTVCFDRWSACCLWAFTWPPAGSGAFSAG